MTPEQMRIVLIGAGSVEFSRRLLGDILSYPELRDATIVLHDIDPARLRLAEQVAHRLADASDGHPTIEATLERARALDGADHVITTIEVGGRRAAQLDFEIPGRYGLRYTINDTIGIGGVMRGLRVLGPMLEVAADMERYCPDAWLLNHSNPLAMIVRAIAQRSRTRVVGLCHSVTSTLEAVSRYLGVPADEIDYVSGGLNHLAFMLELRHRGRDLYPALRTFARGDDLPVDDLVRLELLRRLEYYPTESSEHHAEYSPWFIPKPGMIERFGVPIGEYLQRVDDGLAGLEQTQRDLDAGAAFDVSRSGEYTAVIMAALGGGRPFRFVANVMNTDRLLTDLPDDACVEVPATVDVDGLHPETVGSLPPQCAAYVRGAADTQALTVRAFLEHDRAAVYHAVMLDPLIAAALDLDDVWRLTDELIEAEREWLPDWLATP